MIYRILLQNIYVELEEHFSHGSLCNITCKQNSNSHFCIPSDIFWKAVMPQLHHSCSKTRSLVNSFILICTPCTPFITLHATQALDWGASIWRISWLSQKLHVFLVILMAGIQVLAHRSYMLHNSYPFSLQVPGPFTLFVISTALIPHLLTGSISSIARKPQVRCLWGKPSVIKHWRYTVSYAKCHFSFISHCQMQNIKLTWKDIKMRHVNRSAAGSREAQCRSVPSCSVCGTGRAGHCFLPYVLCESFISLPSPLLWDIFSFPCSQLSEARQEHGSRGQGAPCKPG